MEQELHLARDIQRRLLPRELPETRVFRAAARMEPAREVGGDYYDVIPLGGERFRFAAGDVCGKGVAAGLLMAVARTLLRDRAASGGSLADVLSDVNDALEAEVEDDRFMTLVLLEPEADGGAVRLCLAGHEPPLLARRDGRVETMEPGGMALGMLPGIRRHLVEQRIPWEPGDVLLCCSDGVTEARDARGALHGRERLKATVARSVARGAQAVIEAVLADLEAFRGGAERSDDVMLLALERKAP